MFGPLLGHFHQAGKGNRHFKCLSGKQFAVCESHYIWNIALSIPTNYLRLE